MNSPSPMDGVELAGTWGCAKAGFRNCGSGSVSTQRTPGVNSQQNGVTATRGCNL